MTSQEGIRHYCLVTLVARKLYCDVIHENRNKEGWTEFYSLSLQMYRLKRFGSPGGVDRYLSTHPLNFAGKIRENHGIFCQNQNELAPV